MEEEGENTRQWEVGKGEQYDWCMDFRVKRVSG